MTATPAPSRIAALCREAAASHGVAPSVILSRARSNRVVAARWDVMRRLRDAGFSYPAIGRAMGRDHSTVIHALRRAG